MDPASIIIAQAPSSFWKLNEASGTSAADSTGSRTATTQNGLVMGGGLGNTNIGGAAPLFDGVNDYIQLSSSAILTGLTDWTIVAIVKSTVSADMTIYSERAATGNALIRFSILNGKLRGQYRDDAGNLTDLQVSGGQNNPLSGGSQLMGMRKQGTKLTLLILGGEYDSTTLVTGTGAQSATGVDARLGFDRVGSAPFNGTISYVQVFTRALLTKELWDQQEQISTPLTGLLRQPARGRFPGGPRTIWNQLLEDSAPLHPNSANFVTEFNRLLGVYGHAVDANFGYGAPVNRGVADVRKTLRIHDPTPYPQLQTEFNAVNIPPNLGIASGTDQHACVDDWLNDEYWESWLTSQNVTFQPNAPTFTVATTGGTIPPGSYRYGVTPYTDALGVDIAHRNGAVVTLSASGSRVTISWGPVVGADGYKIYVKPSASGTVLGYLATVPGQSSSSFVDDGSLWPANFTVPPGIDTTLTYTPFTDPNIADADFGGVMRPVSPGQGYFLGSDNLFGASATSLPVWGGLITAKEAVRAGRGEIDAIQHALAMAVPISEGSTQFLFPAQRTDAGSGAANAIRAGTRFRLSPAVDVSSLAMSNLGKAIARAFQRYGGYVRDISGAVTVAYAEDTTNIGIPYYPAAFGKYDLGSWTTPYALAGMPWTSLQVVDPSYTQSRAVLPTRSRRR